MPKVEYTPRRRSQPASRKVIHYHGPFYDPSGYAQAARGYALTLAELGWEVKIHPARFWSSLSVPLDPRVKMRLMSMESPSESSLGSLRLYHMTPEFYPTHSFGGVRTCYVVTEVSRIHPLWVDRINRMHTVFTASEFCKQVFIKSGVTRPIYVVPHGFDPNMYYPAGKLGRGPLRFISVFQWTIRKGFDVLLKAYLDAFKPEDDVELVLVTYRSNISEGEFKAIEADMKKIIEDRSHPKITMVRPFLAEKALADLYRGSHVFVLPSRGEGFCLPCLEAMACGCMPVVTDATALPELVRPDYGRLIKVNGWVECYGMPWIPWYRPAGGFRPQWVEPSVDSLADIMKWCYENRDEVVAKGAKAAKVARENYTWVKVTQRLSHALEKLLPEAALRVA